MNRQPVQSSNLRTVGYDSDTHILEIEFHHGGVYQYFDVPEDIFQGLLSASSKGKYHHRFIKKAYRYARV